MIGAKKKFRAFPLDQAATKCCIQSLSNFKNYVLILNNLRISQPPLPVKLSPLGEVSLDFCLSPCFGSAVLSAELGMCTADGGETVANTSPLSDAVEDLFSWGWLDKLRSASRLATLLFLLG